MVPLYRNSHVAGTLLFHVHGMSTGSMCPQNMYFPSYFPKDPSFDRQTAACRRRPKVEVDFQIRLEGHCNFYHHGHLSFLPRDHAQVRHIDPFRRQPFQALSLQDWG